MASRGNAPLEVKLRDKRGEDYVAPPPPAYVAFSGPASTLGSSVPSLGNAVFSPASLAGVNTEWGGGAETTVLVRTTDNKRLKIKYVPLPFASVFLVPFFASAFRLLTRFRNAEWGIRPRCCSWRSSFKGETCVLLPASLLPSELNSTDAMGCGTQRDGKLDSFLLGRRIPAHRYYRFLADRGAGRPRRRHDSNEECSFVSAASKCESKRSSGWR